MPLSFSLLPLNRNHRIFAAMCVIALQRVLQLAITFITIPLILHALGAAPFGIWGAVTSLSWLGGMLDLGLGAALITLVAQGMVTQNFTLVRDHMAAGIIGSAIIGAVLAVVGSLAVYFTVIDSSERIAFIIAIIGLGLNVPLSMANNVRIGLQKSYVAASWDIVQTILVLGGVLLATSAHEGVLVMVGVSYGGMILASALSTLHLWWTYPELRPQKRILSWDIWRPVLAKGGLLAGISIAVGLSYALDNVLTLTLLGPLASARMAIAMRIGIYAISILNVLTQPLWPAFTDADGRGEYHWIRHTLLLGTGAMILACLIGGAILVSFGEDFLHSWLHSDLGINTDLLWAIAIWIFILSVPRIAGLFFNAMSLLKFHLLVCALTSVLALILKYVCATHFGIIGILLSTPISWLIVLWPTFIWRLCKWWNNTPA